ncbi:hypothetical protein MYCTH_2316740 [Thermothelomyces thermophilus ATCC 42464]|uniref:BZIP domain-containing protein n=1 Tax=Thermothelomyces thermophilus (strain ATCC 42464 / BCRC 31852 / DSM 1799) TaxID=573729 RepID=G2QND7_THET4|nr:uncharacterized protein MYCTH_2316740 [Thermothelomyces thermophilus ATCC 42464]AEO62010.1 hypothetical protein MYCTH_2316740 [Thermothelomyces thermophilus ATCC 42464]
MAGSQQSGGGFDPLEFMDFSQYDSNNNNNNNNDNNNANTNNNNNNTNTNNLGYQPSSLSPSSSITLKSETSDAPSLFPSNQGFSAPSHQYDLYKQQTGLVPGALTTTLSMNEPHGYFQEFLDLQQNDMLSGLGGADDVFDFNAPLTGGLDASGLDLDMGFQTQASDTGIYLNSTINPSAIGGQEPDALTSPLPSTPALSTPPGRVWPGIHQQQAALRAQQRRQQQQQQQQQQQVKQAPKPRSPQTSSSIAEQNVQQILNSMRSEPVQYTPIKTLPHMNFTRRPKTDAEMDEDEKFLASEEGKKLSSQERRQLRNKVSARAFRGRRKEYISWLETQLTDKVNEAGLLRAQNQALIEENARLTGLTKMLLSSEHFRDMLADLSSNPQKLADLRSANEPQAQQQARQQAEREAQMQARLQANKDANPHLAEQQHLQYQEHFRLHMMANRHTSVA